jgi:hypothetical protein
MTNNHGFRQFSSADGGGFIKSISEGRIEVLIDFNTTNVNSVDFSVSGSGCQIQPPNRTNLLWVMPGIKSNYYISSVLVGFKCKLYFVRAYGTEWANVVDTEYFDLVIKF